MRRNLSLVIAVLMLAAGVTAQTSPDADALTSLLKEFLAGASRNDAAMHDRFWAEDLIYTGSAGRRIGKADVMRNARSAPAPKPGDPVTTSTAEDIRIQQYGETAIVAFRLVGTTQRNGRTEVANYLNSGTFLKRGGKWQVVNWQSTRMPREEEAARSEVSAAEAAFHRAMLAADLKTIETLVDENFVWTSETGGQLTRQQLLDQLKSGQLKYTRLDTGDLKIQMFGDTALVRRISRLRRSSIPGSGGPRDSSPLITCTLTFVNRAGWKLVAMHTSVS